MQVKDSNRDLFLVILAFHRSPGGGVLDLHECNLHIWKGYSTDSIISQGVKDLTAYKPIWIPGKPLDTPE